MVAIQKSKKSKNWKWLIFVLILNNIIKVI
jgi:hypothetical protein